jgi:hypothetical protein
MRGKPIFCGVEVMVEIAEYEASDAPTACTIEDRSARRVGGAPAATTYRFADGRFLKMRRLGHFGETSVAAALTGFAVSDIVGYPILKVRRNVGPYLSRVGMTGLSQ